MAYLVSSAAIASINRATLAEASLVGPFNGLKLTSAFPITRKLSNDINSLPNNGGKVQCMQVWPPLGKNVFVYLENHRSPGYYDGRYRTLWKLPMFGCTDVSQVLKELEEAKKEYPNAFIRIIAFDNRRQVQCIRFIAYKPLGF